ncbi:MAG: bifunctional phosphopantothenoylcysteine decarboxylase/phosphopantothenate--cysteine ligase CoaBC [Nitrospinae bacterium]|nr:bifunctional phosphopantothenoylcysteine decarboxylase/phosphopantothenate--cysteine ligase CoaBC [Nitrospinota bacterium]
MAPRGKIILGVTGGVAAYKAADIARRLMDTGYEPQVVMTANAEKFVTPLTFEAVTGRPALLARMPLPGEDPMPHISALREAALVLVAPATADVIGKMANGIADDTLTTMLLAAGKPVIVAPAMNTRMYNNPAVRENMEKLKSRGITFVGPGSGLLACGDEGEGKLAPVEEIVAAVERVLETRRDMEGLKIIITAGGTREPVDAVRFIGNRSSGKMGVALAEEAFQRGADVTLIAAAMEVEPPASVTVERVESAEELYHALSGKFDGADMLIMAAAVGDYRSAGLNGGKVKKMESWSLTLEPNRDILFTLSRRKTAQFLVGFAAETENAVEYGREKLEYKNLDMIVINDVSRKDIGFGSDYNEVTMITRSGAMESVARSEKPKVARAILDLAVKERNASGRGK